MDLDGTKDNVLMSGMWITEEVSSLVMKGQLKVPPPIVSRCYQEVSNGMLGFNQAMKIKIAYRKHEKLPRIVQTQTNTHTNLRN